MRLTILVIILVCSVFAQDDNLYGSIDPTCAATTCLTGTTCVYGQCIPNTLQCRTSKTCAQPESCINGVCYNRCKTTKCRGGDVCIHGECVPEKKRCRNSRNCKSNQICTDMRCVDRCSLILCQQGYICQKGRCVRKTNNNCGIVPCPIGTVCIGNTCVPEKPDINVCPKNSKSKAKVCKAPRPTEQNCQGRVYIAQPAYNYCGVRADGTRVSFVRECQACKDVSIQYYFDEPCNSAPFVCQKNEYCNDYYCTLKGCKADQECPYDWQICVQGECLDSCARMRCAGPNPCKFGQCNYIEPSGTCSVLNGIQCQNDWTCSGGECIDQCTRTRCPAYYNCVGGGCQSQFGGY